MIYDSTCLSAIILWKFPKSNLKRIFKRITKNKLFQILFTKIGSTSNWSRWKHSGFLHCEKGTLEYPIVQYIHFTTNTFIADLPFYFETSWDLREIYHHFFNLFYHRKSYQHAFLNLHYKMRKKAPKKSVSSCYLPF